MSQFLCKKIPKQFFTSIIIHRLKSKKSKITFGDPVEHATGIAKRELLAILAGNDNPFDMRTIKRGPGTRSQPNEIPSAFDSRLIGCLCEKESNVILWMWLHKGEPKRCECGHWFNLVQKAPL